MFKLLAKNLFACGRVSLEKIDPSFTDANENSAT